MKHAFEGQLITSVKGGKVYFVQHGKKRWISSSEDFDLLRFQWDKVIKLQEEELNKIPDGDDLNYKNRFSLM